MNKLEIIAMLLGAIGCVLFALGYLIRFKKMIHLVAGVKKDDARIANKEGFARLLGQHILVLGFLFIASAVIAYFCFNFYWIVESVLLICLLVVFVNIFIRAKKYIGN